MEVPVDKCLTLVHTALTILGGKSSHPYLECDPVDIAKALEVRACIYQQYQKDMVI